MNVEVIETAELGDRSYVVSDESAAVVIDPQRDLDRVERVLERVGKPVRHVLETHVHNDYVTGGYELARRLGAAYGVNGEEKVSFERNPLRPDDVITAGGLRIRAVPTPGHTDTHLAYLVVDDRGEAPAVFTGGSLLFGAIGRTDLVAQDRTDDLSRAQYRSVRRLGELPRAASVYPTHGFGSFCSGGGQTGADKSTIGEEVDNNRVFAVDDEDAFVAEFIGSLGAYPAYYAYMAPINRTGPGAADLRHPLPALTGAEVSARLAAGQTVIDLRERAEFARGHVAGALNINLDRQLATYVGWLVPFGAAVTLIADSTEQLADARRQLARIGYDDLAGYLGPVSEAGPPFSYERVTFANLADGVPAEDVVLDVRRVEEYREARIPGSVNVPIHELRGALGTLPHKRLWVHCMSGFRAAMASSILQTAGFDVVHVDDDFENAVTLGLSRSG
jgi:glyoxylase-like metal-dependent hydrolase (beta-lactamase superfamily II)/rhodanese-related sulfurtransferase